MIANAKKDNYMYVDITFHLSIHPSKCIDMYKNAICLIGRAALT